MEKEFLNIARDILVDKRFKALKSYRHHIRCNAYYHSVKVAYFCYRHHKRFKMKSSVTELVRGALLHDYYIEKGCVKNRGRLHMIRHPKKAYMNALRDFGNMSKTQNDIILRHMFPLTLKPPKTKYGYVVCFYDKVVAVSDFFGKNLWKKYKEKNDAKSKKSIDIQIPKC